MQRGKRKPAKIGNTLANLPEFAKPNPVPNRQLEQVEILLSHSKQRPAPILNRQLFLVFFFA
ncbi:MAG: hypothetical protein WB780_11660, partial [Candidatus Acidiferrales bacterium]